MIRLKLNNKSKIFQNLALISQIGISMAVPILGGIFLGNFLDNKFNTGVVFLIIFSVLGIITSFITLFKLTTTGTKRK
ncbi:AtpZ/AtpI family protein [Caldisalinibacter kiritimatiensis]|uniref:AtpZ/AtpI family protein n=1 Tax=Caldisalinibacter kiritimatiensis TaxID=1304284 RepID=UPI0005570B09|nr:AtpZ/AtpI family protein [Caldisalinibacter kiritimatiensis]